MGDQGHITQKVISPMISRVKVDHSYTSVIELKQIDLANHKKKPKFQKLMTVSTICHNQHK